MKSFAIYMFSVFIVINSFAGDFPPSDNPPITDDNILLEDEIPFDSSTPEADLSKPKESRGFFGRFLGSSTKSINELNLDRDFIVEELYFIDIPEEISLAPIDFTDHSLSAKDRIEIKKSLDKAKLKEKLEDMTMKIVSANHLNSPYPSFLLKSRYNIHLPSPRYYSRYKKAAFSLVDLDRPAELKAFIDRFPQMTMEKNESGASLLALAVSDNREKVIDLLLSIGANLEQRNYEYMTPLHLAVMKNNYQAVKKLVNAGAIVNSTDKWGRTPMDYAVAKGNLEIMDYLVLKGK